MNSAWTRFLPGFILKRIEDRHELLEVLGNTGWMMGDQILRQLVGLLVGVWLARYLGPQLFGDYSYAIAMVMIVSPMATLALDGIAIRSMVQDPILQGQSPRHLFHFDAWRRPPCLQPRNGRDILGAS